MGGNVRYLIYLDMSIRPRKVLIALALGLLCAHAISIIRYGSAPTGALLSDIIQLAFGVMLVPLTFIAGMRSHNVGRHYWRLTSLAYCLWVVAQSLATYQDRTGSTHLLQPTGFLFSFWFVPLGMALFLDPESNARGLDRWAFVDLIQGLLFLATAYFYFFLVSANSPGDSDLATELRLPYLACHTLIAVAFMLRGWLAHVPAAEKFLHRFGLFLLFSCGVDVLYYYGPGTNLQTGDWFDILWSVLLVIPLMITITWEELEPATLEENPHASARNQIATQAFTLLFPALILVMAAQIGRSRPFFAAAMLVASFACSSARLLLTQKRLLLVQHALRREAGHDGLTSVWNHTAILGILDRELIRAQRNGTFLGVMMIDVDCFKAINDGYGHAAGDSVLRALAREFGEVLRTYDSLGRYGGEEFLVVAPGCGLAESHDLAERIRVHVAQQLIAIKDGMVPVTVSIGVTASGGASAAEQLLQAADSALYRAKGTGRNRVEVSDQRNHSEPPAKVLSAAGE
jgi:diguanylate cyclase (GGDEF)-like protein